MTKILFLEGSMELGSVSTQFWDFPNISQFPKIQSLQAFSNSWGDSYTNFTVLEIDSRFTWSELNLY